MNGPAPIKHVQVGSMGLPGDLCVPDSPAGLVVFAHGSGSSRTSPRNRGVAQRLQEAGFATLLFDLLTPQEAQDPERVFDVALLTQRMVDTLEWVQRRPSLAALPVGLFGASTGAAAALGAAAARPDKVFAVVSRGGRPDLAHRLLSRVQAPVLLVVGGADTEVLVLNRQAQRRLGAGCELAVVPQATHLFEERGALEQVARLAVDWFAAHVPRVRRPLAQAG